MYRFLAAYIVALLIADISFLVWPATSAAASFLPVGLPQAPHAGIDHIEIIEALRSGQMRHIELRQMIGLITVPSFHAVDCVLYTWATWKLGCARWPFLIVNTAMLLSTPIHGGHYFTDILAGFLTAALSIFACSLFRTALLQPSPHREARFLIKHFGLGPRAVRPVPLA